MDRTLFLVIDKLFGQQLYHSFKTASTICMAWRYRIVARVDRPIFLQSKRDTMVGCLSNLPLVLIDEVYSLSVYKTYIQLV